MATQAAPAAPAPAWWAAPQQSQCFNATTATHTAPLLQADTPGERPSRNRRLLFVGGVAAAVLVVLAAIIVLGANHSSGSSYEVRFLAVSVCWIAIVSGSLHQDPPPPTFFSNLLFLAPLLQIGDWGRQGGDNQTDVAELMERVAEGWPVDFIVSTGDNFYDS